METRLKASLSEMENYLISRNGIKLCKMTIVSDEFHIQNTLKIDQNRCKAFPITDFA